ncbi:Uma2 family endonuclease [Argonema galeatum]|uniref:Uma2 family endonuclease n=1 Tax=Argonema galeatum TaxID=2942762 RepID=UPI0020135586|nr:Uma2 family endonuclease [Argonema galeatum]MCL1467200.1 Uma2 family endonuclease [Argonema galeatum A003/A1]
MMANLNYQYISPEEYLEAEMLSAIKHEYRQGQVYAIAGASDAHVLITGNLLTLLRNHVRGKGCLVYVTDMKAQIDKANTFYYPDIMVTCDERDRTEEYFKRYPCLIIEVLSRTTEAFDRGDKFADYRKLDTLQEYVLISSDKVRVDCFRRNSEGRWVLYPYTAGEEVHLASLDFRTAIANLYEDVSFGSKISA